MKILNQTYREVRENETPISKTYISDLSLATELDPGSLIHIVQLIPNTGISTPPMYESMKMEIATFQNKVYEAVQNTLKTAYWDTHLGDAVDGKAVHDHAEGANRPKGSSFREMVEYLRGKDETKKDTSDTTVYAPVEVDEPGVDGFVKHIYYDFDVLKRYMVLKDDNIQDEIERIQEDMVFLDCYFEPNMKIHTTHKDANGIIEYTNDSVNHLKNENDTYCQMSIQEGNRISNEWTTPAQGNLVVYGWLDSSACLNNKAIPSAFCVLEADINENWEILAVQPVTPAKNITYVGFNVMVKEGLVLRVRTGFNVGAKSGGYSNENDGYDTLANITPNGFKCQIFSSTEYKSKAEKEKEALQ